MIRDGVELGSPDLTLEISQKWAVKKISWTCTNRFIGNKDNKNMVFYIDFKKWILHAESDILVCIIHQK